eukprot:847493-Pelagomonas_calceolata.AAC.4
MIAKTIAALGNFPICPLPCTVPKGRNLMLLLAVKVLRCSIKGSIAHACNHRMLAVTQLQAGMFYWLYANVFCTLLQEWCLHNNKIPDSQFGFFPSAQHFTASLHIEASETS